MKDKINQEIIEAGPEVPAPTAGKKKIPVPMIELIVIRRIVGKFSTFFN
tara:strand:+ start:443 stop:589 length:147 start_codon:yes stop_codon:yes gene_type:complete